MLKTITQRNSPIILASAVVNSAAPANTSENALATISIPGGIMGPNGSIEILYTYRFTNNANNKIMRLRFSGIGGTAFQDRLVTTQQTSQLLTIISNAGATNSQVGMGVGSTGIGETTNPIVTSAVDTTVNQTVVITGQKANAADTIELVRYRVVIYP